VSDRSTLPWNTANFSAEIGKAISARYAISMEKLILRYAAKIVQRGCPDAEKHMYCGISALKLAKQYTTPQWRFAVEGAD
jgi:hypothetical protein